ncbi:hypothetical protein ACFQ0I_13785 [Mariniflexile aquimaris]|uniref:Uncharacterized protein n=1 Tax=Mariniflexile aquimaris TaxID=881009 RepID=A0ABW3BV30_9FLAO
MKTKWYFGALLIVFTLLGVYQNEFSEPNQEIALNFTDVNITSDDIETTISQLKVQLQAIGITNVRVKELKDGYYKIAYYSASDVASIKEILSKDKNFKIGLESHDKDDDSSNNPSNKKTKTYKFDIYELHKSTDAESGLGGKCVLSFKQDYDRFYNPNVIILNNELDNQEDDASVTVAFKLYYTIAIALDNSSGNIPEGRAGPTA